MSIDTPKPGRRRIVPSLLRHYGLLFGIAATSLLVFLGASSAPVPSVPLITIEAAMEWNAFVDAGMGTMMNIPGLPARLQREQSAASAGNEYVLPEAARASLQTADAEEASIELAGFSLDDEVNPGVDLDLPMDLEYRLHAFAASLTPPDSLDIPPADSTNRAKFLPQRPRPSAVTTPFPRNVSPLYLKPSRSGIQRIIEVDSVSDMVTIREVVNGKDVRVPVRMTLQDYIQARYNYERDRRTAEKASEYVVEDGDELQQLLKNITEIDIPVAPNPLMSIFGDRSRISVRINGTIDINAGFKIETSDQQSVFLQPTQFSPNFKQQVQINVNGLVGDKLSIQADWSTERTFDYENQLKIKYTGYEDEIIQSIEAGNVSLQTPSTLVQGSGALFGIKAEFQAGPFRLAAIASQKKGESSKLSLNGGSQESEFERHAYDYSESHYFVDVAYREGEGSDPSPYEAFYNYRAAFSEPKTAPVIVKPEWYIKDIEVWISRTTTSGAVKDPEEREVVAYVDLGELESYKPGDADFPTTYVSRLDPTIAVEPRSGEVEVGTFKRIQRDVDFTYNPITGIITLNQSLQDDQIVAVAFRVEGESKAAEDDLVYGTFAGDNRLQTYTDEDGETVDSRMVLKLVKPKNLGPSFETAWKLQVRSIYSLNTRNLTAADLANFKIVLRNGGQPDLETLEGTNAQLIRLFGLDYTDENGGVPDGKIDFVPGETVDPIRGEIIFPTLEPWGSGMLELYAELFGGDASEIETYTYPEVYTQTKTQARQSSNDKILITGKTRGTSSAVYNLGFNVVEGSVRVLLNGTPLTPGVDYTVDYTMGQVRITKEEALVPEAKVDIEFEKQDLFTFASKTLVGARGELDLGKDSYFGFTYMSLNQKTLSDKVRIGEEPISNSMFGIDAKTDLDLPILTDALNTLPFISTKEKSSLMLQGEAAMVMPEESSKTSTIPSDGGEGIAYLDDFEGSRIFIPLQTAYSVWRLGSVPEVLPNEADSVHIMQNYRSRLNWYNLPITSSSAKSVTVDDIWPDKSVAREDQRVTVLDLDFYPSSDPNYRGQYNYTPDLANERRNWASIMRLLPVNATNLVDGNFNYIEMWMKVENTSQGKLIIDLGKISEDVIPNSRLNSEDDVLAGSIRNGILNPGEDIGLDMLTEAEEQALYPNLGSDPSLDNFVYDPNNWSKFNGTQGNIDDPAGQFPDTEDLNNNSILDLANDFYRYEIDLDTTRFGAESMNRNAYVVGGGHNGWYQFRIPLAIPDDSTGSPALDNVEYMRVVLTDMTSPGADIPANIRIAEFNFVGNQWYERIRNDEKFAVSVVNIEDNPGEYTTPEGVIRPRDRTRPDQEIYGNEQSLSLDFYELEPDSIREAYRLFPGNGIDLFNYRQLKMYVHGDQSNEMSGKKYEMVMRFGIDTANYYEYRTLVEPGWTSNNEVAINFSDLTAVKSQFDSASTHGYNKFPVEGKEDTYFWVKGNPDIVRVQFISVGVRNLEENENITGRLWINELRVIQPNTQNGYAYNASMNLRLADIADVSANISHSDPYFHSISERFSTTRSYTTNWSLTTTLNIDRVLPEDWKGTQARVTYTHSENLSKPLLVPGQPDVEVEASVRALAAVMKEEGASTREIDEAVNNARIATQSLSIRDSWAIPTLKLKAPGDSWLVTDVVNRLELSYNYSIIRERNTVFRSRRNWQWQARVGYGYDFGREAYIEPFKSIFDGVFLLDYYKDAKWYFLPTRVNVNASLERSRIEEVEREPLRFRPFVRTFTHNRAGNIAFTLSEESLLNISGSYSANLKSSLLGLETDYLRDENGDLVYDEFNLPVVFQRQSSSIFNDMFFGRNGSLYFGEPTNYQQQFSLQSRPVVPGFFGLDRYVDLNASYQVSYNWQQNIQQAALGRTASYNATISAQMNLKLKTLFDPLWESAGGAGGPVTPERTPAPSRRSRTKMKPAEEVAEDQMADLKSTLRDKNVEELLQMLEKKATEKKQIDNYMEQLERLRSAVEKENELEGLKQSLDEEKDLEKIVALNEEVQRARAELLSMITLLETGELVELDGAGDETPSQLAEIFRELTRYAIKIPFLDYDNIGINFTQNNSSQVGGVRGETGFSTFWGSVPFGNPPNADDGPSRLYQLGLISDPNPSSGRLAFKSSFPFIGIEDYSRGLRAANPGGTFADNYSQSNTFSIKTNRPLWEGARLELNWDLRWSMNKNYQIDTDENGLQTIASSTTTGKLERSYMAFPDFFVFSLFNTNMGAVNERFEELQAANPDARPSELLAEAFEDGFEAVPWLSGILGDFFPRLNYGFRWDGLEKWSLLEGIADRISLEHRYQSNFSMAYRHSQDDGSRITETKQVGSGFKPLIGVQLAFNQVWGGDLSVQTRWDKTGNFNLNTSASNIVEDNSDEFTLQAEFKKAGFEMPLFGLSLKNDIQFTMAFSLNKTSSRIYSISDLGSGGQPREGITRISIEPRVRYSISQRVQASLFYRYQRTRPDEEVGSRIPGTTSHEGGLEMRITIAGS